MPALRLAQTVLLPELRLLKMTQSQRDEITLIVEKVSSAEVCPRCATLSRTIYDRRWVSLRDEPVRDRRVWLRIKKRRFSCRPCGRPFTEPVPGVLPRRRTTQRYKRALLWAAENFSDLSRVKRYFRCSDGFLYQALYDQLERKRKTRLYPWPKTLGIDEHAFLKKKRGQNRQFVTMIVDYTNKRVMEVALGKSGPELKAQLHSIPGRENVRHVNLDLADSYKSFVKDFFPNAEIIADKFHVLRLLHPAINRERKRITGDRRSLKIRSLLLTSSKRLDYFHRQAVWTWLEDHPELKELYRWKEGMHGFYRIKGRRRAEIALTQMTDEMAKSKIKEIKTLRRTLMRWRREILNYFEYRLTNARTEGYNNKAKVIKRRSYGFRSFENYRLRLLNACA